MVTTSIFAVLTALATNALAAGVTGAAEGFAKAVSGGGSATPVYPSSTDELVSYLEDDSPRVIVLNREFDFTGTEGTATDSGCSPWGTDAACQIAINKNGWCDNYQSSAPQVSSITYDAAAILGITVNSDKTLVGEGSAGVIRGKGLRFVSGVSNIIIQNIAITDLNPHYVWGGDAITLNGCDLVWIDHVTTSNIGRQHIVLGEEASGRVTISNCEIDGSTNWSATCDGHHYWALLFTGSNDLITLKGNYIHHTSGRSPKVLGNTLLHSVNNYWYANSNHAFEVGSGAYVVCEGSAFSDVLNPIEAGAAGVIFTVDSDPSICSNYLGRACERNAFGSSGSFASTGGTGFLANFQGKNIASADPASNVPASVKTNAGIGKL